MNVLIFMVAGVAVGWTAKKLYDSYVVDNDLEEIEDEITEEVAEAGKESTREEQYDDLSQLKGVGPKLVKALDEVGIHNFEQLSKSSVDLLLEKLRETGGRFSRPVISAVIGRAMRAAKVS